MASDQNVNTYTLEATAALADAQLYCFAKMALGKALLNTTAGGDCVGVIYSNASAGEGVSLAALSPGSIVKVRAGAAGVTADTKIQSDALGKGADASTTDHVLGTSLEAAAAGEVFRMLAGSNHLNAA